MFTGMKMLLFACCIENLNNLYIVTIKYLIFLLFTAKVLYLILSDIECK